MATNEEVTHLEPWQVDFCETCGEWSEHTWLRGSETRNSKGVVLSILVRCGNTGCNADREDVIAR